MRNLSSGFHFEWHDMSRLPTFTRDKGRCGFKLLWFIFSQKYWNWVGHFLVVVSCQIQIWNEILLKNFLSDWQGRTEVGDPIQARENGNISVVKTVWFIEVIVDVARAQASWPLRTSAMSRQPFDQYIWCNIRILSATFTFGNRQNARAFYTRRKPWTLEQEGQWGVTRFCCLVTTSCTFRKGFSHWLETEIRSSRFANRRRTAALARETFSFSTVPFIRQREHAVDQGLGGAEN